MAFNVNSLSDYVNQSQLELLHKTLLTSTTRKVVEIVPGVKSSKQLPIIDTEILFQTDNCNLQPSGSTTFSGRNVVVGKVGIIQSFCPKTLESKYTQQALKAGSTYSEMPFEQYFSETFTGKIAEEIEKADWLGSDGTLGAAGTGNLSKYNGFLTVASASLQTISGSASGSSASQSVDFMQRAYNALPVALISKEDTSLWAGWDMFSLYVQGLTNLNLYHYKPEVDGNGIVTIPGTMIKVRATNGLNSTGKVFGARSSNMFIGTDLEGEEDKIDIWESKDDQDIKAKVSFKAGSQVAFPNEVVIYTRS
jgi:hypothetical protein